MDPASGMHRGEGGGAHEDVLQLSKAVGFEFYKRGRAPFEIVEDTCKHIAFKSLKLFMLFYLL